MAKWTLPMEGGCRCGKVVAAFGAAQTPSTRLGLPRAHIPAPPLSDFVAKFWSFSDVPSHAKERIVPSGTLELAINLNEDEFRIYDPLDTERYHRFSGAMVSGAYRRFFVIDTRAHASIVGVHFKPAGALPFLGLPPSTQQRASPDWSELALECGISTSRTWFATSSRSPVSHPRSVFGIAARNLRRAISPYLAARGQIRPIRTGHRIVVCRWGERTMAPSRERVDRCVALLVWVRLGG